MLVEGIDFGLPLVACVDLSLVLLLQAVKVVFKGVKLARPGLKAHFSIGLAYLKLLGPAHFILVGLDQL